MRTTISLDDEVAKLAERMAALENRNFSNLCEVALVAYCAPLLAQTPEDQAKFLEKVKAAAKRPSTRKKIERLITEDERKRLGK